MKSMKKLVLAGLVLLASVMVLVGCDTNAGDNTSKDIEAKKTPCAEGEHTGGAATCTQGKLCDVCGVEYETEKDPENHASENNIYVDNADGTHSMKHECCGVAVDESEEHTIENHVCTACGTIEVVWKITGDYDWQNGDTISIMVVPEKILPLYKYKLTAHVADDGTVTWTPDKPIYWVVGSDYEIYATYPFLEDPTYYSFSSDQISKDNWLVFYWAGTATIDVYETFAHGGFAS